MEANREYKDSIIRALLNDADKALRLYCDITGKRYDPTAAVEMKSIEAQFLSKLRNDISFIIDGVLVVFFEHQATLNKNMPLRLLQYIVMFYAEFYKMGSALYADALIKIPKPEFYVLYNGKTSYPPIGEMRLSDAFMLEDNEQPALELVVRVININHDTMPPQLRANEEISGYAQFAAKVERGEAQGLTRKQALGRAVNECIAEGILVEFLERHRNEVESMFTLVYDGEMAKKVAYEEGIEQGIEQGIEKGREQALDLLMQFIKQGISPEEAIIKAKENAKTLAPA